MSGLQRANERLQHEVWQTAILVCLGVDRFTKGRRPEDLHEFQEYLAVEQLRMELRLGRVQSRRSRRKPHIEARIKRKPERPSLGAFQRALQVREELLHRMRGVLRQAGDACAWEVLGRDPRVVRALFVEGKSHQLPDGIGIEAPMQVASDLNATGRFFAVYNDLTRCLTTGDVTVVDRRGGGVPLTMELKSSWTSPDETEAEIDFISPETDSPLLADLVRDVRGALGLMDREAVRHDARAERQGDEIVERTEFLMRVRSRVAEQLRGPASQHWSVVRTVLERAYATGSSFDIAERGVVFFGLRVVGSSDPRAELLRTIERMSEFQAPDVSRSATSEDLATNDELAALVLPVPLWPLPGDLRNAVLSGRLFFACVVAESAWYDAFANEGLDLTEVEGEWVVELGGETGRFDILEVQKLTLGVIVGGVSPAAVAGATRSALEQRRS